MKERIDSITVNNKQVNFIETIGKGGFGIVCKCEIEGNIYAVKKVHYKDDNHKEICERELHIWKKLNHENIVKCHECWLSIENIYFLMDYFPFGDLNCLLNQRKNRLFTEEFLCSTMKQISSGLFYLYNQRIIHRDIKPSNILLTGNGTMKIADFGTSRSIGNDGMTFVGTYFYLAPEIINGNYDYSVDIYSFGCVMYELATLHRAFDLYYKSEKKCPRAEYVPLHFSHYSEELIELIYSMIIFNPKERITITELIEILSTQREFQQKIERFEKAFKQSGKQTIIEYLNEEVINCTTREIKRVEKKNCCEIFDHEKYEFELSSTINQKKRKLWKRKRISMIDFHIEKQLHKKYIVGIGYCKNHQKKSFYFILSHFHPLIKKRIKLRLIAFEMRSLRHKKACKWLHLL